MKEIYLAMDGNGAIWGFENMPYLGRPSATWRTDIGKTYSPTALLKLGIDVTAFPLTHETPLKIRAKWEVCDD